MCFGIGCPQIRAEPALLQEHNTLDYAEHFIVDGEEEDDGAWFAWLQAWEKCSLRSSNRSTDTDTSSVACRHSSLSACLGLVTSG